MRLLAVEHHQKPTIGEIGTTLADLGVEYHTMWGMFGDEVPCSHQDYDGIIILGGSMTALDDEACPYFPPLIRLIREFSEADKPVMGVCLGAQLVARSFGAELYTGGDIEFGFHTVSPTRAAASDPVLKHLDRPLPLFQWHTDHYELPPGAVHLATGERYEYQAYRLGQKVYGMQFHFEAIRENVETWIPETPSLEEAVPDYREWLPQQFAAHEERSKAFCRAVTRNWVELA